MTAIALIVAAGRGQRAGLDRPKQYIEIAGRSVLRRSIEAFLNHPHVDHVAVVINEADKDLYEAATQGLALLPPVPGGAERQASVKNGLEALTRYMPNHVLIHDAARPFVKDALIDRCLEALSDTDAVLPALAISDTLKQHENGRVTGTLDRSGIAAAQTPQCFAYPAILAAHRAFAETAVTDDIALAELAEIPVKLVAGDAGNFKITMADDVKRAERLLLPALTDIRTGQGFDVHAFAAARALWLCGVQIPHDKGLKGHSDADVALHALTDALLGALGAGDIGQHFPPSDARWKGVSSDRFLAHAHGLLKEKGGIISSLDLTIICEAPKIGPHRDAMKMRIAEILSLEPSRINIKGTTTEKLGFTGRGEGIAAQSIITIRLPE